MIEVLLSFCVHVEKAYVVQQQRQLDAVKHDIFNQHTIP